MSSATLDFATRSRRRSVFSIPTTITGRITAFLIDTSTDPTTCGKSSAMPPSGM
ncbi:hypothetical protein D3C83_199480 [compost metagenome]